MAFRHVRAATAADWAAIGAAGAGRHRREFRWCLRLLRACRGIVDGFAVDQLTHSLIAATLAERAGAPEELVLAALLHDVAKPLSVVHHPAIVAEMLREYVSDATYRVLRHHGELLADVTHGTDGRARYRDEPWYADAVRFAEWDAAAFDPAFDHRPLGHFLLGLRRLYRQGCAGLDRAGGGR